MVGFVYLERLYGETGNQERGEEPLCSFVTTSPLGTEVLGGLS